MGGPIALGSGDRMPRAQQRMQPRQPHDDRADRHEPARASYDEEPQWHVPHDRNAYDDVRWREAPARNERDDHAQWNEAPRRPHRDDARLRPSDPVLHVADQSYLAAHAVEKSFGTKTVVRGASLYVRRGEAVGLLGPNGAGKTTIFYMITGLIKADRGRIELDGHDVTALPMYQRARLGIGYLPQEASIFRGLNVEDNIRAVLEVVEPNRKRREHDLEALLEEFDIARVRKTASIALSGGERRRVEIARALATRPNYMLLDEPFAGDRAYIIYSGEVLMEGRTEDIINNPEVRRLYLGEGFRL
jgi:lipopolysaccharide export system ATP-binding protein